MFDFDVVPSILKVALLVFHIHIAGPFVQAQPLVNSGVMLPAKKETGSCEEEDGNKERFTVWRQHHNTHDSFFFPSSYDAVDQLGISSSD